MDLMPRKQCARTHDDGPTVTRPSPQAGTGHIPTSSAAAIALILLAVSATPAPAASRVYFGNLHAYSNLSDAQESVSPESAYAIAKTLGDLDFLSISDHTDLLLPSEMDQLRRSADEATDERFVALFGQAFSGTRSGYNRMNIHNYPRVVPAMLDGRYRQVVEDLLPRYALEAPDQIVVAGFDHPVDSRSDYGLQREFAGNWPAFVAAMDPVVQLVAISTGPTDAADRDFIPEASQRFLHRDVAVGPWFEYLSHGMHVAPQVDHGTHSATYVFRLEGRTAVWVDNEFTRGSLLEALAGRHCYATEDRNLHILAFVGQRDRPGDLVRWPADGILPVTLHIHDPDEPNARYSIEVWAGRTGSGRMARKRTAAGRDGVGAADVRLELEAQPGEYYVVHVRQSATESPCGHADDAWLAPIWVEGPNERDLVSSAWAFVAKKGSRFYHDPRCAKVARMSEARREYFAVAPEGHRMHVGCNPDR